MTEQQLQDYFESKHRELAISRYLRRYRDAHPDFPSDSYVYDHEAVVNSPFRDDTVYGKDYFGNDPQ